MAQIEIATAAELAKIGNPSYPAYPLDGDYVQTADITGFIGGKAGTFAGSYDGQGYGLDYTATCPIFASIGGRVERVFLTGAVSGDDTGASLCNFLLAGAVIRNCRSDVGVAANIEQAGLVLSQGGGTALACLYLGQLGGDAATVQGTGIVNIGNTAYWDKTLNPGLDGEATYGLTTAQLKSGELPSGFDPKIWMFDPPTDGVYDYPRLRKPTDPQVNVLAGRILRLN